MYRNHPLGNFATIVMARVILTTVNVLLIVTLTLQPSVACWVRSSCNSFGSQPSGSLSCSCCTAERAGQGCACCNQQPEQPPAVAEAPTSCCHAGERSLSVKTGDSASDAPATAIHSNNEPAGQGVIKLASRQPHATCLCLKQADPLGEPVPRTTLPDGRELHSALDTDSIAATVNRRSFNLRCTVAFAPLLAENFSQILFCVWRL